MNRRGVFVLLCALLWGLLAPWMRVALVSSGVLTAGEVLTTTFRIGFFTLVLPLMTVGVVWALVAMRLWRTRVPWYLIAIGTFFLCFVALLIVGVESAGVWASEPGRILRHAALTALPVTAGSFLLALLLLGARR